MRPPVGISRLRLREIGRSSALEMCAVPGWYGARSRAYAQHAPGHVTPLPETRYPPIPSTRSASFVIPFSRSAFASTARYARSATSNSNAFPQSP